MPSACVLEYVAADFITVKRGMGADKSLPGVSENTDATFAVGVETQNFSRCGGCTREQVFEPEQLQESYYNPKDALINKDPRMKTALKEYAAEMRKKGFDYDHPDEAEIDVRERLHAITGGGTVPVEQLSPGQRAALERTMNEGSPW